MTNCVNSGRNEASVLASRKLAEIINNKIESKAFEYNLMTRNFLGQNRGLLIKV